MAMFWIRLDTSAVAGALQSRVLHHLDPVVVRVEDEGDLLHPAIGKPFLPVDIQRLEAVTSRVEVVNRDT